MCVRETSQLQWNLTERSTRHVIISCYSNAAMMLHCLIALRKNPYKLHQPFDSSRVRKLCIKGFTLGVKWSTTLVSSGTLCLIHKGRYSFLKWKGRLSQWHASNWLAFIARVGPNYQDLSLVSRSAICQYRKPRSITDLWESSWHNHGSEIDLNNCFISQLFSFVRFSSYDFVQANNLNFSVTRNRAAIADICKVEKEYNLTADLLVWMTIIDYFKRSNSVCGASKDWVFFVIFPLFQLVVWHCLVGNNNFRYVSTMLSCHYLWHRTKTRLLVTLSYN